MHVLTKVKPGGGASAGADVNAGVGAGSSSRAELLERAKANFKGKHRNSMNYFTTTPGLPSHGPPPANNRVAAEGRVPYSERQRRPSAGPGRGKRPRSYVAP